MKRFLYEKEIGRWILAGLGVLLIYILIYKFSTVRFATNDDNTIINSIIYSSEQSGLGEKSFMYIHFLLGIPLSLLYKYIRNVPWYDLYSVLIVALSLIIIWKAVIKECYKKGIGLISAVFILSVMQIILFSIPIQQVQFTTTAGVIGTAAIVNYLCMEKKSGFWLTWLLVLLGFFQRTMVGYVILAFLLVLIVGDFILILMKKKWSKESGIYLLIFLLLPVSVLALGRMDENYRSQNEGSEEFQEYSALRVQYMDYGDRNYWDNSQIYKEAGWDEKLCVMVSCWYFMDERYNTENLEKILSHFDKVEEEHINISEQVKSIWSELSETTVVKCILVLTLILCLVYSEVQKSILNNRWIFNLVILGVLAGCVVMILYLCLRGRLPLRVFMTIFMPVDLILAVINIQNWPSAKWKNLNKIVKRGGQAVSGIVIAVLCLSMAKGLFIPAVQDEQQQERNRLIDMKQYVNAQKQNIYIYGDDLTGGEPIFYRTTENTAYNCFFWGGTSMFSDMYYSYLEKNGLTELHSQDWFRDNVYYLAMDDEKIAILGHYLNDRYDNVVYDIVDSIGNIKVTKFVQEIDE